MTSVRCARCGETVHLETANSARCPNCSALLDVSIDLESGGITATRIALIVDDNEIARTQARAVLEAEGYRVVEASNGPDAALLAARHNPSLALVDETMPAMSGAHAARLVRRTAPMAVVVAFVDDETEAPREWADAAISKHSLQGLPALLTSVLQP
jgi:CheY-like chemotaxis protein